MNKSKIYYCRPVRLDLWKTFNSKPCGNVIPTRLVGAFSVRSLECSHKICGNTFHNKVSEVRPQPSLMGHLLHMPFIIIVLMEWHTLCKFAVGKGLPKLKMKQQSIPDIKMRILNMKFNVGKQSKYYIPIL